MVKIFNLKKPLLKDEDSGKKNFVWSNSKKKTQQTNNYSSLHSRLWRIFIPIVSIVAYFIVLREIVLSSRENFAALRSSFFFVCLFFLVRLNGLFI